MSETETKPNIVIIGGGYAGISTAQALDNSPLAKTHQIILLERKTHFWHNIGSLRAMVEDDFEQKLSIPYDKALKNGKVIHVTVTTIHKNEVLVSTETEWGTKIPFKYLIIATGSNYPRPCKVIDKDEAVAEIKKQREAVKKASKILIIGGGPVGIELAGEIATTYHDKTITLVNSEDQLLAPKFPKKLKDSLRRQLEQNNVKLIFGEKVQLPEEGIGLGITPRILHTDRGTEIESDVQFVAVGAKANTELVETLDQSLLEEGTRLVKVLPTFQLDHEDYKHIFAVGDITNVAETKLAYRAGIHGELTAKNIIAMANGKKLLDYKPGAEAMFVTIGKTDGSGLMPIFGMVVGGFMVRNLKGKNLFVDRNWKMLTGAAPPS